MSLVRLSLSAAAFAFYSGYATARGGLTSSISGANRATTDMRRPRIRGARDQLTRNGHARLRMSAKWLELLKEVKPKLTRVPVIRDPVIAAGIGQWSAIQAVAPSIRR